MQRYGWQARQARIKSNSQTNSNLNQPINSKTNETHLKTGTTQSKNVSYTSSQAQKKGKITKVSSISSNPLFQGMDFIPTKKEQIGKNQVSNEKNKVKSKQLKSNVHNKQQLRQKQVQNTSKKQISERSSIEQNQLRNQRKTSIKPKIFEQFDSKKDDSQQQFDLRFKKTTNMSDSLKMIHKQPLTERLQIQSQFKNKEKINKDHINQNTNVNKNKSLRQRNKIVTETKKYDLLDDILFGNRQPIKQKNKEDEIKNNIINFKTTSGVEISPINKKTSNQYEQKLMATQKKQIRNLYNQIGSNNIQNDQADLKDINFSSKHEKIRFQRQKQSNKIQNQKKKKKSMILIFCLVKTIKNYRKNIGEAFIEKIKHRFMNYTNSNLKLVFKLNSIYHIFQNKLNKNKQIFFNNMKIRSKKLILSLKDNKNTSNKNILALLVKKIAKKMILNAFNKLNSVNFRSIRIMKNLRLLQFLANYYLKKSKKFALAKLKGLKKQQNKKQNNVKNIYTIIDLKIYNIVKFTFQNIKFSILKNKITQQNFSYESPKIIKKIQPIPQISYSDPKKNWHENQLQNQSKIPIRKTGINKIQTQNLRAQKQLQMIQKQNNQQITNSQLRIQQLKQIISQYGFQINFKQNKVKQLKQILNQLPQIQINSQKSLKQTNTNDINDNKFSILWKIYVYLLKYNQIDKTNQIQIDNISKFLKEDYELADNQGVDKWILFYTNLKIKKQIKSIQQTIKTSQPQILQKEQIKQKQKRIASEAFVQHQQKLLSNLLRNYIKQQYQWQHIRAIVKQ